MKTQKTKTLPTQTTIQKTAYDYVVDFCSMVEYSRANRVEPMAALSVIEIEGLHYSVSLCLYCTVAHNDMKDKPSVAMLPYFYAADVAELLKSRGILTDPTTTNRTGISVTWFRISPTLI